MSREDLKQQWTKEVNDKLKGKTIKEVRYMTEEECEQYMWDKSAVVIFFTDGTYLIPSQDDEGNGAGSLFTSIDGLEVIPTI